MQNAIINGLCRLSISSSHDYQCDCRAYKALIVSAKPKTYRTLCRPYDRCRCSEEVRKHHVHHKIAESANLTCVYFYIDKKVALSVLNLVLFLLETGY